jgi:hypothetical protein
LLVRRDTRMVSDRTEVTAVTYRVSATCLPLSKIGLIGRARPLSVYSRGCDGEEVAYLSVT